MTAPVPAQRRGCATHGRALEPSVQRSDDPDITELQETVESQINDAVNRRSHALAQIESLKDEIDKVFGEYETHAKRHQEK